jgi:hypothetical protein
MLMQIDSSSSSNHAEEPMCLSKTKSMSPMGRPRAEPLVVHSEAESHAAHQEAPLLWPFISPLGLKMRFNNQVPNQANAGVKEQTSPESIAQLANDPVDPALVMHKESQENTHEIDVDQDSL